MDKFTAILIQDYESKIRKVSRKNTQLRKELEIAKYQQAQMCKRTLEIFNLLGYEGKDIIKLYECIR